MTEQQQAAHTDHSAGKGPADKTSVKIHRVCIGCNNMFEITMDHIDAKHCPACHKG